MKSINDLEILKKYLLTSHMAKIYLAAELGYSSTHAIDKWIKRKNIPRAKKLEVLKKIKELSTDKG